MAIRITQDVIRNLPTICRKTYPTLPVPLYTPSPERKDRKVGLAVSSMKSHMTDEGWQIFYGLQQSGYVLCGHGFKNANIKELEETDVPTIVSNLDPGTVVVQDKREWDVQNSGRMRDFRDPKARFHRIEYLKERHDIFKVTILKDAHQRPAYHRQSAEEIGCHAWIIYYHPRIVKNLAPYVRAQHLIRTYHTVNPNLVPMYNHMGRKCCILSGAVSKVAYPMRMRLYINRPKLYKVDYEPHPGYHRNKCHTPDYLKLLSRYKVSICTSSIYGYALRKIIESTACGCVVITDLPADDILPGIDDNLIRVDPSVSIDELNDIIRDIDYNYNPDRQRFFSKVASCIYDPIQMGHMLDTAINNMRDNYHVLNR